jgi:hypothetical protein
MNQLMLVVVAVVALCYCGGNYCPAILKKNKEMLLGVAVGMALCSFMDLRMEGFIKSDMCCKAYTENNGYVEMPAEYTGVNAEKGDCIGSDSQENYEGEPREFIAHCDERKAARLAGEK